MISLKQNSNSIVINIEADIYNSSSQAFNLFSLRSSIAKQLQTVFHTSTGNYSLDIQYNITCCYKLRQCSAGRVLFQIVDTIPGNNPAEADFKGLRIKLNCAHVQDIIDMRNTRTIPHELGHLLGWDHPHAKAQYESVNLSSHVLEQQLTEDERKINLMSQTWYAQRAGIPLQNAMQISDKQIDLLLLNYNAGLLNINRHMKQFLWWKKILD